jgi:asparagine synthase (glutamine-hydrolysing)
MSKKIRHRGPDWSGTYVGKETILCHERLAIVGVGECALQIRVTDGKLLEGNTMCVFVG